MNYYDEIKHELINNELTNRVKDYSKNRSDLETYYKVGKLLSEAGKKYGKGIIKKYSNDLMVEVRKKYNERTHYRMRKFYQVFSDKKLTPLVSKLNWSHCILLLSLDDVDVINYYITQVVKRNLSKRELEYIIKNNEYDRIPTITRNKISNNDFSEITDFIKDPILINNNQRYESFKKNKTWL